MNREGWICSRGPKTFVAMLHPSEVALIFDLDNTLIHSTIDFRRIRQRLIALLREAGDSAEPEDVLMTLAIPQLVEHGRRHDDALAERMWAVIVEEEDIGLEGAAAVDHAAEVLRELDRRQFRLGLLTNNRRGATLDRLKELDLWAPFDAIATRDDVTGMKPLPDGVGHLLAGLPGVRQTYLIGDSWVDGQTADAAGARFIGFGPREAEVRARGVAVWTWITDLRQLLEIDLLA